MEAILSIKDACKRVGLSRTTIWDLARRGEFPRPVKVSAKRKGFVQSELDAWIQERIAERDGEAA